MSDYRLVKNSQGILIVQRSKTIPAGFNGNGLPVETTVVWEDMPVTSRWHYNTVNVRASIRDAMFKIARETGHQPSFLEIGRMVGKDRSTVRHHLKHMEPDAILEAE